MNAPFQTESLMPAEQPMPMPVQSLHRAPPLMRRAGADTWSVWLARAFVFGFASLVTGALGMVIYDWFRMNGIWWVEASIIGLAAFTIFGIALSVATSLLGCLPRRMEPIPQGQPLAIALLMPVYGEHFGTVIANLRAMLADLERDGGHHSYRLTILSDTRDPELVSTEMRSVEQLCSQMPQWPIAYRHRDLNIRYKAGNIGDWVKRWGGGHDAMLVLDADSVMSGRSIRQLADTMAADPSAGLVQSIPRLVGAQTLFARTQQFANAIYGANLARGLTLWSGNAANYWGHNALIRVAAFAGAAGLPDLPGRRPFGGVILSHDFVEASLIRRAGWSVRFTPTAEESYEGTPATPMAHILRDRRWCQGNLQHLRILAARGLHPISRFHMLQGAMAYIASLGWFFLLLLWVLVGMGPGEGVIQYFNPANPLFPAWPDMDLVSRALFLILIYGMLVAPRVIGALMFIYGDPGLRSAGGTWRFALSFLVELGLSILLAPMMMVQHVIAVTRTLIGKDTGWRPASLDQPSMAELLRFHRLEVALGAVLAAMFTTGLLSLWLLPIALCLLAAPWLSWATGFPTAVGNALFYTPQECQPPRVLRDSAVPLPPSPGPVPGDGILART